MSCGGSGGGSSALHAGSGWERGQSSGSASPRLACLQLAHEEATTVMAGSAVDGVLHRRRKGAPVGGVLHGQRKGVQRAMLWGRRGHKVGRGA